MPVVRVGIIRLARIVVFVRVYRRYAFFVVRRIAAATVVFIMIAWGEAALTNHSFRFHCPVPITEIAFVPAPAAVMVAVVAMGVIVIIAAVVVSPIVVVIPIEAHVIVIVV